MTSIKTDLICRSHASNGILSYATIHVFPSSVTKQRKLLLQIQYIFCLHRSFDKNKKKTKMRLKRSDQIWSSCEWDIFTTRNFTNAEAEFYFQGTSRIICLCRYSYPQSRWSFNHNFANHNFASIIPLFRTNYKTNKCNSYNLHKL